MLTTLWVMSIVSVLAAAAALSGRVTVNAARNRIAVERAEWTARGCMARVRAAIDEDVGGAPSLEDAAIRWTRVDRDIQSVIDSAAPGCSVGIEAVGARLDVNDATTESLARLFGEIGFPERADSLADAIADWRDSDDVARPYGAERDWYVAHGRRAPSDTALADIRELTQVRGFESDSEAAMLLSTDAGRVSLANASADVLVAVPGITREAASAIIEYRERHDALIDLASIASTLPEFAAESLNARYPDAARMSTPTPDAWLVTTSVQLGLPRLTASVRIRLERSGYRTLVSRVWGAE